MKTLTTLAQMHLPSTFKTTRRERVFLGGLITATFLSRIPFRAHVPYGLDSIQFILGLKNYDVRLHQPHPPGYFLFVMLGRVVNKFFQDPNLSFVVLNMVLSCFCVGMTFVLAKSIFNRRSALLSAALMATSPSFWFHGEVALSNMADCFFVCLLALLCWRNLDGDYQLVYLSAVVLGLAGGVRQNTLVFLFPLWMLSIRKAGWRRIIISVTLLMVTVIGWYLPMTQLSGGIVAYQSALRDHWLNSNWHGFTLQWLLFNGICVSYFILLGTGLGSIFLFIALLFYLEKMKSVHWSSDRRPQFFTAWLIPPLAFFVLVYSHPIQTGHSLLYLPAMLILLPASIQLTYEQIKNLFRRNRTVRRHGNREGRIHEETSAWIALPAAFPAISAIWVALIIGGNLFTFLGMNTVVSQTALRQYETKVSEMVAMVKTHCAPEETILVNYDFMFLGFRDFMFHLPDYHAYQTKLYSLFGRPLLFAAFQQKTQLIDSIQIPSSVKYFVLNADEFIQNPDLIQGIQLERDARGHFLKTPSGLRLFRGDIQDLQKFFPRIPIHYQ